MTSLGSSPVPKAPGTRRRRNFQPAAKADRQLPVAGRDGLAPDPPIALGVNGKRWWDWAWSTPQATTWTHDGFTEALAKRAELEDIWSAGLEDRTKLLPAMMKLDEQFGLTPRSAAQLHLFFEDAPDEPTGDLPDDVTDIRDRLRGLGS